MTILDIHQTSKFIHRSPGAIRNLVLRGRIPYRKVGGRRLVFLQEELEKWIMSAPGLRLEEITRKIENE